MRIYFSLLLIISVVLLNNNLYSQQDPYLSFYQEQLNVFNPARVGSEGQILSIISRNQWVSIKNAPKMQIFSLSSERGKNVGLGISIISEKYFIEKNTIASLDFSYKLPFNSSTNLFLGIRAGGNFFSADLTGFSDGNNNSSDPAQSSISFFKPNLGIGAFLKGENYWVSLSVPRMLKNNSSEQLISPPNLIYTYFASGVKFNINDTFSIKPSLLMRNVKGYKSVADFTFLTGYKDVLDIGGSYRTNSNFSLMLLTKLKSFTLGYAYEAGIRNKNKNISLNTHEVILRFQIGNKTNDVTEDESIEE